MGMEGVKICKIVRRFDRKIFLFCGMKPDMTSSYLIFKNGES